MTNAGDRADESLARDDVRRSSLVTKDHAIRLVRRRIEVTVGQHVEMRVRRRRALALQFHQRRVLEDGQQIPELFTTPIL